MGDKKGEGEEIESETRFLWKLFVDILLTPVTFALVILGKREWTDLFEPFFYVYRFMFEAKFTIMIIIVNVLVMFVSVLFFNEEMFRSFVNYPSNLLDLGSCYALVTCGFLHGSLVHLFGNMLGIFVFGRSVERKLGSGKTAMIYFGALIVSSLFYSVVSLFFMGSEAGAIGASGALMGLVAAAMLLDPFGITYQSVVPLPNIVSGWLVIYADISGILGQVNDGIAHFAHIGGFLSITVTMFLLKAGERAEMQMGFVVNMVSLCVAVVIFFFVSFGYLPSFEFDGAAYQSVLQRMGV